MDWFFLFCIAFAGFVLGLVFGMWLETQLHRCHEPVRDRYGKFAKREE